MPIAPDLCYLPATEPLALFRRRELSPVELMEVTLARAAPFHAGAAIEALLPWLDSPERRPSIAAAGVTA